MGRVRGEGILAQPSVAVCVTINPSQAPIGPCEQTISQSFSRVDGILRPMRPFLPTRHSHPHDDRKTMLNGQWGEPTCIRSCMRLVALTVRDGVRIAESW